MGAKKQTQEVKTDTCGYEEIATEIGTKIETVYSLVSQKRIPHYRLGPRYVRFSRARVREWLESSEVVPVQRMGKSTSEPRGVS